uniref:Uncharacterized protein n=1 Tax=Cacopsylla melanoneura TaxID=428564 RepID=A0A8D8Q4V2_9HEMI
MRSQVESNVFWGFLKISGETSGTPGLANIEISNGMMTPFNLQILPYLLYFNQFFFPVFVLYHKNLGNPLGKISLKKCVGGFPHRFPIFLALLWTLDLAEIFISQSGIFWGKIYAQHT